MKIQTNEHYEAAARRYCVITGANPEQPVSIPGDIHNGTMTLIHRTVPLWRTIASQMLELSLMLECINEADK
jgi:hypothetical protein